MWVCLSTESRQGDEKVLNGVMMEGVEEVSGRGGGVRGGDSTCTRHGQWETVTGRV